MLDSYLTATAAKVHLTAAGMATLMHEATSPNAVALRDEVLALLNQSKGESKAVQGRRTRRPQQAEVVRHQQTLEAILGDLILASGNQASLGYCYRSKNRQGFTDSGTKASSRAFEWQIAALKARGLIDLIDGLTGLDDFDGDVYVWFRRATRLRATPDLLAIAQRHGISAANLKDHYVKRQKGSNALVQLRNGHTKDNKGKTQSCPDNETTRALRGQIARVNAIYAGHKITGIPTDKVRLRRVFNRADERGFRYNKGGRLYDDFQGMLGAERAKILIDGEPVIELDLKASQLTILHGITEAELPEGDPYWVKDVPRGVVKAIVTTMIGLGHSNPTRWSPKSKAGLLEELGGDEPMVPRRFGRLYPMKATASKVLRRLPGLYSLTPGRMDWADLQFIESEILLATILELGEEHGIPALPVHDSIIVPRSAEEVARACLGAAFERLAKRKPIIEAKL